MEENSNVPEFSPNPGNSKSNFKKFLIAAIIVIFLDLFVERISNKLFSRQVVTQQNEENNTQFISDTPDQLPTEITPISTSDDFSEWAEFTNLYDEYTVKYPINKNWIAEISNEKDPRTRFLTIRKTDQKDGAYWIDIYIPKTGLPPKNSKMTEVIIDDINVLKEDIAATPQSPRSINYFFKKKNKNFEVSVLYRGDAKDNLGELVLSTIEILQ
jgi:hypothetical protein